MFLLPPRPPCGRWAPGGAGGCVTGRVEEPFGIEVEFHQGVNLSRNCSGCGLGWDALVSSADPAFCQPQAGPITTCSSPDRPSMSADCRCRPSPPAAVSDPAFPLARQYQVPHQGARRRIRRSSIIPGRRQTSPAYRSPARGTAGCRRCRTCPTTPAAERRQRRAVAMTRCGKRSTSAL